MIRNEILVIGSHKVLLITLEDANKKGAIGVKEGEQITKLFELATQKGMFVVMIITSSGINVHEGVLGLMQMTKISAAIKEHSDKGLLYISVIRNFVLGGVSASFATSADIIIAEEESIFGFSGKRIIFSTTHEDMSEDFQTAKYCLNNGMVDILVKKEETMSYIKSIIRLH